ncbi:hypothetical protein [Halarcobacter sp.]|uniref:hypothetical protein n=1 Tax=Halarcobacter sp. TaxID=2321133 RepID=UPI0029F505DE|nr:hypothetical protein [Halarcobacter sp.]
MKKIVLMLIAGFISVLIFTGCATSAGQFLWDNRVPVYKVVVKGVDSYYTKKEIEEKRLDKIAELIEYAYSVEQSTGKVINGAITE